MTITEKTLSEIKDMPISIMEKSGVYHITIPEAKQAIEKVAWEAWIQSRIQFALEFHGCKEITFNDWFTKEWEESNG